jgi:hypothetical protein
VHSARIAVSNPHQKSKINTEKERRTMKTKSMKTPTSMKILTSMFALAILVAGLSNAAAQVIIVIDRDYNSGNFIAEYSAWDSTNPFDGIATNGAGNFNAGTGVGVASTGGNNTGLRRPAFFFQIPTGYTSAQINDAKLRVRLNTKTDPTTALNIYSAALNTLGTKDAAYAISTFSSGNFTDTGLGLATTAANSTNYEFNVTSLVKNALDLNLATTVVAFRFQMKDDTTLTYGTLNNYNIIGFDGATIANRPALTLDVIPEPGTVGLLGAAAGFLLLMRRRRGI